MILSCGDALIDFVPVSAADGREAVRPAVGGSCLNIAVGLARLGVETGFVGGISTDLFGRMIADHALASNVDLRHATRSDHAVHDVALGENTHDISISQHWQCADVVFHHEARRFEHAAVSFNGVDSAVLHDIVNLPHR